MNSARQVQGPKDTLCTKAICHVATLIILYYCCVRDSGSNPRLPELPGDIGNAISYYLVISIISALPIIAENREKTENLGNWSPSYLTSNTVWSIWVCSLLKEPSLLDFFERAELRRVIKVERDLIKFFGVMYRLPFTLSTLLNGTNLSTLLHFVNIKLTLMT